MTQMKATRRAARTIAKERLYRHIYRQICRTRANFNIGVTTGIDGDYRNRWLHSYRHWLFVPLTYSHDPAKAKKGK